VVLFVVLLSLLVCFCVLLLLLLLFAFVFIDCLLMFVVLSVRRCTAYRLSLAGNT